MKPFSELLPAHVVSSWILLSKWAGFGEGPGKDRDRTGDVGRYRKRVNEWG